MSIKAYSGEFFSDYTEKIRKKLEEKVSTYSDQYILNTNEQELKESLYNSYTIGKLSIKFDSESLDYSDREIPIREHPNAFLFGRLDYDGQSHNIKRTVIQVQYPFEGDPELLIYKPSTFSYNTYEIAIRRVDQMLNMIYFEIIRYDENSPAETIRRDITARKETIQKHIQYLDKDIDSFNQSLPQLINKLITEKKSQVEKKNNFLVDLGIPLLKRDSVPETFVIPAPVNRKKMQVEYPVNTPAMASKPDPTLDENIYKEILSLLNDVGKAFEKYPSICEGKNEESIRDILLLFLETNFVLMSATAESFNKNGKTDILLKYQNHNVFVAECKIWNGVKKLLAKDINQLLGYLTWRDSKSSLLIFVRENTIDAILQRIDETVKKHPNFVSSMPKKDQSWFGYKMTLPDAQDKEVNLAVIVFHLPPKVKK